MLIMAWGRQILKGLLVPALSRQHPKEAKEEDDCITDVVSGSCYLTVVDSSLPNKVWFLPKMGKRADPAECCGFFILHRRPFRHTTRLVGHLTALIRPIADSLSYF